MNCSQDRGDVAATEQNGFHYQTSLGITSRKIEKIYEQWSKELSKHDYGSVKSGKCEKPTGKTEWKSSRKENICVNTNEGDIMSKKSYRPGEYVDKYSEDNKKLPPFRTGKYIPKDDVYSCGACVQNERSVALSSKPKETSNKMVSGLSSPPPFKTGKYTPNDCTIYVKSPDTSFSQCSSPTLGSPKNKGRRPSVEKIISKLDGICLDGRRSPSSSKSRNRLRSTSIEGKEQISHCSSGSRSPRNARLRNQKSHSADSVDKTPRTRPKSTAMENYANSRSRTRSENMLSVKTSQRPKSSALENSTPTFRVIVQDINIESPVKSRARGTAQNRPRSAVLENSLSSHLPIKIVTNTKGQTSAGKKVTLDRSLNRESNRYLRKGSDSSERGHQRSKTTTSISSSRSERSYKAMKPTKPRRELHRNAAYVKPRRNKNYKPVDRKRGSSRKKSTQGSKQDQFALDHVDSCIPKKTTAAKKPVVISLFVDKFCARIKNWNGQFRIPTLKRYRVMAWKIKRISYLLYEKVLIVCFLLFCPLLLLD